MRSSDDTAGKGPQPPPSPLRLVVIDRDQTLMRALRARAHHKGWESHMLGDRTTRRLLARMRIDALAVDPAALGPDPWQWIDLMTTALPGLAVVVCASGSTVAQRVQALQLGVDDWVQKPTHPDEVIARIESAVRRRRRAAADSAPRGSIIAGELEIRIAEQQAYVAKISAELTAREFEVLCAIAAEQGSVVRRETIYLRVWGYSMVKGDRSVDVHVRKIRHKLSQISPRWSYIHTQVRVGYRLAPERVVEAGAHTTASAASGVETEVPIDGMENGE